MRTRLSAVSSRRRKAAAFCACICVGSGDGFRNCVFLLSYGRFCFSDAQGTACSCVDRFFSVCLVLTFCYVRHSGFFGLPSGDLWNLLLECLSPWICIRRADNVLPGLGLADSVLFAAGLTAPCPSCTGFGCDVCRGGRYWLLWLLPALGSWHWLPAGYCHVFPLYWRFIESMKG